MTLDDFKDDNLIIEGGNVRFSFDSKEKKDFFLNTLKNMVVKNNRNKEEGYTCGNCAAYPCYRTTSSKFLIDGGPFQEKLFTKNLKIKQSYEKRTIEESLRPAGLCFQNVKQCRQECDNYNYGPYPASGGICRKDNEKVLYCQECHIPEIKKSRL